MQNPSANHLNLESRRLVIGVLGVLLGTSAGIAEPPARVSQNVMAANANSTARLLTAPQPPTWAQGLELFGVASIDGIQTAFFGSRDRLHVLSLMVGEKWPGGIELRSIRERAAAGTIAAELAWKTETAILECRWEGVETTPDALIIEPAPTTGLPLPPVRLSFSHPSR